MAAALRAGVGKKGGFFFTCIAGKKGSHGYGRERPRAGGCRWFLLRLNSKEKRRLSLKGRFSLEGGKASDWKREKKHGDDRRAISVSRDFGERGEGFSQYETDDTFSEESGIRGGR